MAPWRAFMFAFVLVVTSSAAAAVWLSFGDQRGYAQKWRGTSDIIVIAEFQ
jgi:hypothetical protein